MSLSLDKYLSLISEGKLDLYFGIHESSAIALCLSFLILSYKHLCQYSLDKNKPIFYEQNTIKCLRIFLWSIGLFILFWLSTFLSYMLFDQSFFIINYNTVWIGMFVSACVIGYYSLAHSRIFQIKEEAKQEIKVRLSEKVVEEIKGKIVVLMTREKIYLDPKLSLQELSQRLGASTNDVSWLLNNVFQKSFYDFINQYRVKEFVAKLENNEHKTQTILTLSMEVGFNSKSTFYKAFKLEMGETPSSYIKTRPIPV